MCDRFENKVICSSLTFDFLTADSSGSSLEGSFEVKSIWFPPSATYNRTWSIKAMLWWGVRWLRGLRHFIGEKIDENQKIPGSLRRGQSFVKQLWDSNPSQVKPVMTPVLTHWKRWNWWILQVNDAGSWLLNSFSIFLPEMILALKALKAKRFL